MITFACSHCGSSLKVKDELAGKQGRCPKCKKAVLVPAAAPSRTELGTQAGDSWPPFEQDDAPATLAPGSSISSAEGPVPDTEPESYDFLAPARGPGELGRLGPYRVLKVLGKGGMGVVFQAEDSQLKRPVALKAMLPALASNAANRQRFLREAQAAAGIDHDHIVTIYQVGEDRKVPFLAMQFLQGESLEDRLRRNSDLPLAQLLRIGRETAEGLAAAHERGLIHRDIKPSNIWLEGQRERVKILDFGLARAMAEESGLTQTGAIMGTPAYMAPEQARNKGVGPHSDLFSLGCVLYRMATGEVPFKGTDTISILASLAMDDPEPPSSLNVRLPGALNDLILALLAKDPKNRPASAREVVEMIEAIEANTADVPVAARRKQPKRQTLADEENLTAVQVGRAVGKTNRLASQKRILLPLLRDRKNLVLGGLAVLSVLGGLVGFLVGRSSPRSENAAEKVALAERPTGRSHVEASQPKAGDQPALVDPRPSDGRGGFPRTPGVEPPPRERMPDPPGDPAGLGFAPGSAPPVAGRIIPEMVRDRLRAFEGHQGQVECVAFVPPDGRRVLSGGQDKTMCLWDVSTGKELRRFQTSGQVQCLAISPDGRRVVSGGGGGKIHLWDLESGQELLSIYQEGALAKGLGFTPDGKNVVIARLTPKPSVQVWNLDQPPATNVTAGFLPADKAIACFALSPDGRIVGCSDCGAVYLADRTTGAVQRTIPWQRNTSVWSMAFSPDGQHLVTAGAGGKVRVWRVANGEQVRVLDDASSIWRVVYSPDGKYILTAGSDRMVRIWDAHTYTLHGGIVVGNLNPFHDVAVSPDGRHVLTVTDRLRSWEFARSTEPGKLGPVGRAAVPEASKGPLVPYEGHQGAVHCVVAVPPDGRRALSGGSDRTMRLWDTATGRELRQFEHTGGVAFIAVAPDGRRAVSGQHGGPVRLWDLESGQALLSVPDDNQNLKGVAFTPDGKAVIIACYQSLHIWNVEQPNAGTITATYRPDNKGTTCFALSPDGRSIGCGDNAGATLLLDRATGEKIRTLAGELRVTVRSIAFSPDGQFLLTAGADGKVRVWSVATGQQLRALDYSGGVLHLLFSPDSKYILASGFARSGGGIVGMFRIWDAGTYASQEFHIGTALLVEGMAMLPERRLLLTGDRLRLRRLMIAEPSKVGL